MADSTNPQHQSLPGRFKQFRSHLGLSQKEFGEKLGLDQTVISAIEVGRQDATVRTIYSLVGLDCNPNWLLLGESPMQLSKTSDSPVYVEVRELKGVTEYVVRVKK